MSMMNGQRMIVEADSASTVQELVHQICHKAGLQDSSGFSIYITLMQRVRHLPHLFFFNFSAKICKKQHQLGQNYFQA